MKTRIGIFSVAGKPVFAAAVLLLLFFCQCTRDKSINEATSLVRSAYFPMHIGRTWSYHVNYNERISTPPFSNVWYTGAERWTLTQKDDAGSSLIFDVNFTGMKIFIDTSGLADSISDQSFFARLAVHLQNGRFVDDDETEAEVFFDNWLRNVDFQIAFPDSSGPSVAVLSPDVSNDRWQYTLERNVGLRSGEWTADYVFGSFHLEYLLFEED